MASRTCWWWSGYGQRHKGGRGANLGFHLGQVHYRFKKISLPITVTYLSLRESLTILNLPYSGLEIIKGQVADLGLETVEIHGGEVGEQGSNGSVDNGSREAGPQSRVRVPLVGGRML